MAQRIWVNIGSGKGLLPDGTMPLTESLNSHQYDTASAPTILYNEFENIILNITATFPRFQWVLIEAEWHIYASVN